MASKKEKLLDSAQRFVLKGQLDKAIKDYQQIVALDPKEIRYRQKLAELLVRDNRKQEAIGHYEGIGRHYADNSYFLKAIAVYKQIQRLSPDSIEIALTLASLNHKQGLTGNAMAEYGQVVARLEKEGSWPEALKVLQQMVEVDGDHAATRLKYAELLHATGNNDASRAAFDVLLSKLQSAGHAEAAHKVASRMAQLFPGQEAGQQQAGSASQPDAAQHGTAPHGAAQHAAAQHAGSHHGAVHHGAVQHEVVRHEAVHHESVHHGTDPHAVQHETSQQRASQHQAVLPSSTAAANENNSPLPQPSGEKRSARKHAPAAAGSAGQGGPQPAVTSVASLATTAAGELPSAFGDAWADPAPTGAAAPELAKSPQFLPFPWEEEIQLDLGDDPPVPATAAAKDVEIELTLDLSLDLDFYEAQAAPAKEQSAATDPTHLRDSATAAPAAAPVAAAAPAAAQIPTPAAAPVPAPIPVEDLPQEMEIELDDEGPFDLKLTEEPEDLVDFGGPTARPEAETAAGSGPGPTTPRQLRGWEEIYPAPDADADSVIDRLELESHYDLGIGYKEMGLYGEAIKEFTLAAANPQRRLDCLTLQAICYREKGEPAKAEELLQRGRALEVLSVEERMCLAYELAFFYEKTGDVEMAIRLYREVKKIDPAFHDVTRRLSELTGDEAFEIIDLDPEDEDF